MSTDIMLDANSHDIDLDSNQVELINEDVKLVAQRISINLLLRAGEYFADTERGVPYLTFMQNKESKGYADVVLQQAILEVNGVEELRSFSSFLQGRKLNVSFVAVTSQGNLVTNEVEV